jgi:hypothetical protein
MMMIVIKMVRDEKEIGIHITTLPGQFGLVGHTKHDSKVVEVEAKAVQAVVVVAACVLVCDFFRYFAGRKKIVQEGSKIQGKSR